MALTADQARQLARPFPLNEHEWRQGRNNKDYVYITETAVIGRLNEIDPSWEFIVTDRTEREYSVTRERRDGTSYTMAAHELAITGSLIVCGVTRYGIGMAEVAPDAAEADKSAVTDALKRAARLFGVGGYLLNDPPEKARFGAWLANLGNAPSDWTDAQYDSFVTECKTLKVTLDEVREFLAVKNIRDYAPGFSPARAKLTEYAKGRKAAPATEPPLMNGGAA